MNGRRPSGWPTFDSSLADRRLANWRLSDRHLTKWHLINWHLTNWHLTDRRLTDRPGIRAPVEFSTRLFSHCVHRPDASRPNGVGRKGAEPTDVGRFKPKQLVSKRRGERSTKKSFRHSLFQTQNRANRKSQIANRKIANRKIANRKSQIANRKIANRVFRNSKKKKNFL
jgi:hypothetical protein